MPELGLGGQGSTTHPRRCGGPCWYYEHPLILSVLSCTHDSIRSHTLIHDYLRHITAFYDTTYAFMSVFTDTLYLANPAHESANTTKEQERKKKKRSA